MGFGGRVMGRGCEKVVCERFLKGRRGLSLPKLVGRPKLTLSARMVVHITYDCYDHSRYIITVTIKEATDQDPPKDAVSSSWKEYDNPCFLHVLSRPVFPPPRPYPVP